MVVNRHSRTLAAPVEVVGPLLERLAEPDGGIWPAPPWSRLHLDGGLEPRAPGRHGMIRYEVAEYEPQRRIRFAFDPAIGVTGHHELSVREVAGGAELVHVVDARMHGRMLLLWPLAIRWLHDALVEDLFDNAERAATGRVHRPARWTPWVRLLRRAFGMPPTRPGATGLDHGDGADTVSSHRDA